MDVIVNIVELASNLAHNALLKEVQNPLSDDFIENEEDLYIFNQDGGEYKEKYFKIFIYYYDYYSY